jgi:hypothetical protein
MRMAGVVCTLVFLAANMAHASGASAGSAAIIHVLEKSAADWNRADIEAFATSYKNSPDI